MNASKKVIKEFELFIKEFHPACTSEGVELDMLREVLAILKEQEDLGAELTNAVELIHKKNKRIEELLKEQEPKLVEIDGQLGGIKYGRCPKCGKGLNEEVYPHWCGFCGQEVKWNA